jgi:hypothetical protein
MLVFGTLLVLVGMCRFANASDIVFGVKPGVLIQSSYFGLDKKEWQPFVGLDMVAVSMKEEDYDASGAVWIPHLGVKHFFRPAWTQGKIAPYVQADYFFSVASVSIDDYSPAEEDMYDDILEFWGFGLAFGAEYYFAESFAVGGEYGFRYLHDKVEAHSETREYYPGYSYRNQINDEFSLAFRVSYAALTASFHF